MDPLLKEQFIVFGLEMDPNTGVVTRRQLTDEQTLDYVEDWKSAVVEVDFKRQSLTLLV